MAKERPPLEEMTLRQLRRVASECGVSRYSRMRKSQLLEEIQAIQRAKGLESAPQFAMEAQETVEAAKFNVGQVGQGNLVMAELADVDADLPDLPGGYGDSRIMLLPRDPQWAYVYWDVPNSHKEELRRQGGQQLTLRLYDVTDINLDYQSPHSVQEYACDEMTREWYLPLPVSDRDYVAELGYRTFDGRWLMLVRSPIIHVPPVYPSDWIEDTFVTVGWDEELRGRTVATLVPPAKKRALGDSDLYTKIFAMAEGAESMRVAGSLYGSMQHVPASIPPGSAQMLAAGVPGESLSSFVFPSGMGMWAATNVSGLTMSGAGFLGGALGGLSALTESGMGRLTMSGAGFGGASDNLYPQPRKFWLVADAELIVYGATEPDATVTIDGQPIKLNSDGTFRFQMSFQDGQLKFPIIAVAADGEQTREIAMEFERETPKRRTNTKEEAVLEWF